MKTGIHPDYKLATVTCSCGNSFQTGSVKENINVELCSECHPFYTGRQKFASADGRVDRFNKKYGIKEEINGELAMPWTCDRLAGPRSPPEAARVRLKPVPSALRAWSRAMGPREPCHLNRRGGIAQWRCHVGVVGPTPCCTGGRTRVTKLPSSGSVQERRATVGNSPVRERRAASGSHPK
jgi:large subunit ribosomal protein L31